ncbi:hypothetical protein [Pedobacter sp. R-06]|uniref:hypothetical protein n=1 Tax=Pedobacter sp. R-06 TaxID=3404051 RepID=UPI003CE73DD5
MYISVGVVENKIGGLNLAILFGADAGVCFRLMLREVLIYLSVPCRQGHDEELLSPKQQ